MVNPSSEAWTEGFPDLVGHPERYVLCEDDVGFDVVDSAGVDNGPGLVIRLALPDGRAALAGLDLLGMIDGLLTGLHSMGLRVVIGLTEAPQRPRQGLN